MKLQNKLIEFRDITLELIDKVRNEEKRVYLMNKREEIINVIKSLNCDSVEIDKIMKNLKIDELEKELYAKTKEEIKNVKVEMQNLKRSRQGNQVYITSRYGSDLPSRFDKRY